MSLNHDLLYENSQTRNKFKKSTKFESNADIFDGVMTPSNFNVMSDNLLGHNSVSRDDIISKLSQFTSLNRAYLLVKFHAGR